MTPPRRLEVHGRLDGDVDGESVHVVGHGSTVEVVLPRLSVVRDVASGVPVGSGAVGAALSALAQAGITVDVRTPRGHVASVGDVGPGHVRPGRDVARPLAAVLGAIAALVGVLVARRLRTTD